MDKDLFEVKGFDVLQKKIKSLGNDKIKRREVEKILGQVANTTVKVAKQLAPVSKKPHIQKRKGQIYGTWITPGTGRKSIGKKNMKRARNPMVTVSPRSTKKADGYYLRQFVIKGTKKQRAQPFLATAYAQTKGRVSEDAAQKVSRYFQKQINKLIV